MKKYTLVFALIAALPFVSADSYANTSMSDGYYTSSPAKANSYKNTTTTRKSGGYNNTIQNNFYYSSPRNARASSYDIVPRQSSSKTSYSSNSSRYDDGYSVKSKKTTTRTYASQERKYFLAHPFFQPLQGKFGSVTDVSYAQNSFKFDMLNAKILDIDPSSVTNGQYVQVSGNVLIPVDLKGKAKTTQFAVKEDFSIGITDSLAVIGMLQYDKTKVAFENWSNGAAGDSNSDSGLNIFGIGLQYRFVDNDDWIAMVSGYYQHQRDTANTFIGELKAGYKVYRNTIYGLARLGYSDLIKGNIYGAYVDDSTGDYIMLSYKTDVEDIVYVEGGMGVFSVLNKYFTLNGELIYGHYDWHDQLSIKGAFGVQPGDMFALNLYASTSLYDSAKGKTKKYMNYDVNPDTSLFDGLYSGTELVYVTGDYKIKNYNEWKVGVQAILYF